MVKIMTSEDPVKDKYIALETLIKLRSILNNHEAEYIVPCDCRCICWQVREELARFEKRSGYALD